MSHYLDTLRLEAYVALVTIVLLSTSLVWSDTAGKFPAAACNLHLSNCVSFREQI